MGLPHFGSRRSGTPLASLVPTGGSHMARKNRYAPLGFAYHVVNRGNDRQTIYQHHFDYAVFIELLADAGRRFAVKNYGFCLMPNHFHLLVEPLKQDELSAFMQWVTCRYACHFRTETETLGHGHVFQRRFWSAPARDDEAFLATLRYIEANPVRSRRAETADLWPWSSFIARSDGGRKILAPLPVSLPSNWSELVNRQQDLQTVSKIREELVPSAGRPRHRDA